MLEVWKWVVERRTFDPFSEFSKGIKYMQYSSLLLIVYASADCTAVYDPLRWASGVVSPFSSTGVIMCE